VGDVEHLLAHLSPEGDAQRLDGHRTSLDDRSGSRPRWGKRRGVPASLASA